MFACGEPLNPCVQDMFYDYKAKKSMVAKGKSEKKQ